jgi:hypothetical protein
MHGMYGGGPYSGEHHTWGRDSGFGIRDLGFEIQDSGFGIRDLGLGIRDAR